MIFTQKHKNYMKMKKTWKFLNKTIENNVSQQFSLFKYQKNWNFNSPLLVFGGLLNPWLKFGSGWFCIFAMSPQLAWLSAAATSAGFIGSALKFKPNPSGLQFCCWLPCWPCPVIPKQTNKKSQRAPQSYPIINIHHNHTFPIIII